MNGGREPCANGNRIECELVAQHIAIAMTRDN